MNDAGMTLAALAALPDTDSVGKFSQDEEAAGEWQKVLAMFLDLELEEDADGHDVAAALAAAAGDAPGFVPAGDSRTGAEELSAEAAPAVLLLSGQQLPVALRSVSVKGDDNAAEPVNEDGVASGHDDDSADHAGRLATGSAMDNELAPEGFVGQMHHGADLPAGVAVTESMSDGVDSKAATGESAGDVETARIYLRSNEPVQARAEINPGEEDPSAFERAAGQKQRWSFGPFARSELASAGRVLHQGELQEGTEPARLVQVIAERQEAQESSSTDGRIPRFRLDRNLDEKSETGEAVRHTGEAVRAPGETPNPRVLRVDSDPVNSLRTPETSTDTREATVRVQLRDADGGSVTIRLRMDAENLSGRLQVQNPQLLRDLSDNMEELRTNLHDIGYDNVDLNFGSGGGDLGRPRQWLGEWDDSDAVGVTQEEDEDRPPAHRETGMETLDVLI